MTFRRKTSPRFNNDVVKTYMKQEAGHLNEWHVVLGFLWGQVSAYALSYMDCCPFCSEGSQG